MTGIEGCNTCGGHHPDLIRCPADLTQTEKPMDTERLKAANANRESLAATMRTAIGMESLPSVFHVASVDLRNQSNRTSLHHTKHTQLFKDQLELAYAGFRQAVMAISLAEAARLEEEFKNL